MLFKPFLKLLPLTPLISYSGRVEQLLYFNYKEQKILCALCVFVVSLPNVAMNALLLLVRYKLLITWRRVKDNIFTLFVLGPLILGFVYLIAAPYLRALALGVYAVPPHAAVELSIAGLIFLLLLAPASSVTAEFYPLQTPDSYLDSLPIGTGWRFC